MAKYNAKTPIHKLRKYVSAAVLNLADTLGCELVGDFTKFSLAEAKKVYKGIGPAVGSIIAEMMEHIGADPAVIQGWRKVPRKIREPRLPRPPVQPDLLTQAITTITPTDMARIEKLIADGVERVEVALGRFAGSMEHIINAVVHQTAAIRDLKEGLPPRYAPLQNPPVGGIGSGAQGQILGGGLHNNGAG